jgi:hypothetical protein
MTGGAEGPLRTADRGKSIPNALHGELLHTDLIGRIAPLRQPSRMRKP